ncbi:MAG: low specificity L-threonine aldolase [Planctomycetota bacterium]|nr:MAG: low specificity L-threonine aldolase [Planctomycetota bacterium]
MIEEQALDYRSDTFTKPTPAMRAAMAAAEVGDDVFDEDPSIHRLQQYVARLLGKEAALFFPSGSMSNQVAVRVHCSPGDEFLCEAGCHIFNYEQGAFAQLSGVVAHTIEGNYGVLEPEQLHGKIRGGNDHLVNTRLVTLENTHNRGAGRIQPYETVEAICSWAHQHGLATHLDGARLFNAAVATGIDVGDWAAHFDTVSVCFSKGLGAPVGSALAGSRVAIAAARRHRKCFGGGMRQAGVLAAAAQYALENHVDRLAEDHRHAQALANQIAQVDGLSLQPAEIDTNMVIFAVDERLGTAAEFAESLAARGLKMLALGPTTIRAVTHLDLPNDGATRAGEILREVAEAKLGSAATS